jgi:hypothetical protein
MMSFINGATRDAYMHVLTNWMEKGNPADVANDWIEMGVASAPDVLADQLKRDLYAYYLKVENPEDEDDALMRTLIRRGLRAVCWQQVADRLLECRRTSVQEGKQRADEEGAEGAC